MVSPSHGKILKILFCNSTTNIQNEVNKTLQANNFKNIYRIKKLLRKFIYSRDLFKFVNRKQVEVALAPLERERGITL